MACEKYESSLTDAALGEPVTAELAEHLRGCAGCARRLDEERRLALTVDEALHAGAGIEPSAEFFAKVRQRVDVEKRRPRGMWPPAWAALAAAALVIVVGILYARQTPPPRVAEERSPLTPQTTPSVPVVPVNTVPPPLVPTTAPKRAVRSKPSPREPEILVDPAAGQALARYASRLESLPPRASLVTDVRTEMRAVVLTTFDVASYEPEPYEIYDVFSSKEGSQL
jgi:hypothetical protein